MATVKVIGAGLAGSEAAWQLAKRGVQVTLIEMKPEKYTPAHHSAGFAELVCSNSLKAKRLESAGGLLKAEMENAKKAIPYVETDSRLGWEPSMLYIGDAWHIDWKLRHSNYILEHEIGKFRKCLEL